MKYCDAMRLGATMKKQGFCSLLLDDKTCAMGAACDAVGLLRFEDMEYYGGQNSGGRTLKDWSVYQAHFPFVTVHGIKCPSCEQISSVNSLSIHLNDNHHWTRNAIADYLQPFEDAFFAGRETAAKQQETTELPVLAISAQ